VNIWKEFSFYRKGFFDLENYNEDVDKKIKNLEEKINILSSKLDYMTEKVNCILRDIYEEENEGIDVICPYCNYEFNSNLDDEMKEIKCPECGNIIELDWDGEMEDDNDDNCSGNCSHCHGCE